MYGIGLTELAILLAVAALIVVFFGLRGQSRLGIQIALVILLAPLVVGQLVMFVLLVLSVVLGW